MSSYRKMLDVWRTLTPEQKAKVPDAMKQVLAAGPSDLTPDEFFDQTIEQGRVMAADAFSNMASDLRYTFLQRLQRAETRVGELEPELERLQMLAGEQSDYPSKQFFLENCIAFWQAAEKRDDVDALLWSQNRLNADWEVKDWYAQDGVPAYSGADIREMLVAKGFNPSAIHIDDAKTYKMTHSPGGGASLSRIANWGNAYYYKAMCDWAGVESVAVTNLGTIIGIEERRQTAGARGVVNRFLRPYRVDPGDVLPREWNNAVIWPEPSDYTEIRF